MYKVVIFDFFGVFCTSIATDWFKKVVRGDADKLAAFQELCTKSDYGKISRADFNKEAAKMSGVVLDEVVKGIDAETDINDPLIAYTEGLIERGFRIACLSNGTREWTLQVIIDNGLGHLFEEIVLSADLGIVKPSLEIYNRTLAKLNITASQAIFVDDRQINVDAGQACGIRSLVFTNTPSFITDFEALVAASS